MMLKYCLVLALYAALAAGCAPPPERPAEPDGRDTLAAGFLAPPAETKPWLYWYWINDHVSAEGITRDLETMADLGIGAALIGNIYLDRITEDGQVPTLSPEWKRLTQHAIREGGRLGVDIGLFNSPGWSQSGGPWNTTDNAMRYLASAATSLSGPRRYHGRLAAPAGDFRDVAVLAFPTPPVGTATVVRDVDLTELTRHVVSLPAPVPPAGGTPPRIASAPRSLTLVPRGTFVADAVLSARTGDRWQRIRAFRIDRSNDMEQIAFDDAPPLTVAFPPPPDAEEFRLELTAIRPTRGSTSYGLASLELSPAARLEYAVEKQLALMHQTPLPLDDAYRWPAQAEPDRPEQAVDPGRVLDLSDRLAEDGTLDWEVPPGEWTVLRIGMLPTGVRNGPAAPAARGPEVDKLNRRALRRHFDAFVGDLLASLPPEERTALRYVVADSYEMGGQNWTDDFAAPFRATYGYDPLPWLPVLSGHIVGSVDRSNRFLWDLRRLVADRLATEYVGGLRALAEEHGLRLWLENYGHWGFPGEFLSYGGQSNFVAGEFWNEGALGSIECRAAASAAHIYGKEQVSAESFTAAGKPFQRHPALLKRRGDWSFTEGINHRVYHVYIHQPYADRQPGVNAWFGTEFNRHNTWFPESRAWIDYERRCGYLLRRGTYVADLAYFIGEDAPKMTGVTDPPVPAGYAFDYLNAEVLRERTSVRNGRIEVAGGPSYRLLVLPDSETMRPEVLERIAELVAGGATVVGRPPVRSPSLSDYGAADTRVQRLATELWQNQRVTNTDRLDSVLRAAGTVADVVLPEESEILWIHRRAGDTDIYFLTNQGERATDFVAGFRTKGRRPEWWDPTTGKHRPLPEFRGTDDHTNIPLRLAPAESGFVVFRKGTEPTPRGKNYAVAREVATLGGPWRVNFVNDYLDVDREVTLGELTDWTVHPDEQIRYFSGTATYHTSFARPAADTGRVLLDLGGAGVLANVTVNGRAAGGLWTPHWQLDVTDYLRPGENELEIAVTNLWVNQLIRDAGRPAGERKTWVLTGNDYAPETALAPSGLVGPVRLLTRPY